MKLDLSPLNYKNKIDINNIISYDEHFLKGSPIKKLDDVKFDGYITRNDFDEYNAYIHVNGNMTILDSVSLEEINYPFDFEIDEEITDFIKNSQNCLDIMEFLWQNIVLEVPIRYTLCDADNLKGDNWCMISNNNEGGE